MIKSIFANSPLRAAALLTVTICSALLILPGATVTSMYFNDLLIFLDGGYRVLHGQVPNRDFHTALGPLSFYIPGLGYGLSGDLGLAMPVGMAALMLLITPTLIHILQSRMRPLLAIPLAIFLLLLLATPMNTGEMAINISFAMFYNRVGWVAIGLLLVMHLEPNRTVRWQTQRDAAAAVLLTMIALYTKMTYGVVAVAFLLLTLLQARQRLWAANAVAICLVSGLVIEAFWGGTRQHIEDLATAAQVSGIIEWQIYIRSFVRVSGEYVVFLFFAGLALWHRPRITDFLFYGFCACAGYALLNQNAQIVGIVTLLVGAAIAAEVVARHPPKGTTGAVARGTSLAAIVLMLPIGLSSVAALGLHAGMAAGQAGVALDTPNGTGLRIVNSLDRNHFNLYSNYGETLETGAALLASLDMPPSRVLAMDFVSPFTSLTGISPPEGGSAWMHDNRNFDMESYLPAEEMLGGVDIVMIPERPIADSTTEKMEELYGDYLEQHFQLTGENEHWRLYQRRNLLGIAAPPAVEDTRQMSLY
ncbi:hypothetical protein V8J82_21835 [Gymnodinialimonas sp. 2305UL16-5]|uniref:hypothetical protein n=1 Tax=Gymnodinialimonas mytili TaxID=3126503 RepID=UPI0030B3B11F